MRRATQDKSCWDCIITRRSECLIIDYRQELETDCYYLRVELEDGRCGWTSPIWASGGRSKG